jgi:DEAD/DEAH box helicase
VDRSLRRDLLELALGGADDRPLPTAAELQELLAEAEIRLVTQQPHVEQELLDTAWYLHGIASVSQELQLYTPQRQRRAFQVSAHIFDVALAEPRRASAQRLELGFAAQIGYQRGGLEPNSIAMYQRLRPSINDGRLLNHVATLSLEVGIALLGFERRQLFTWIRIWRTQLRELARRIGSTLDGTMFGPVDAIVYGADDIFRFLTRGDGHALRRGRERLAAVVRDDAGMADVTTRWVAAQLDLVAAEAERGSIWTILPAQVPRAAREAMTLTEPGILTLWEPQRELVEHDPNPLSPEVRRVVMSLPTSAGKTLLAQLFMVSHLALEQTSVCYVAPLRSLGREVRRTIRTRLHLLQRELAPDLPDFLSFGGLLDLPQDALDALIAAIQGEEPDVDIMTPERLAHLLRQDPEGVLRKYGLFVFDEAHVVGDRGRGFTFEWVVSYLHWRTLDTPHRLVLLSAALGNRGQVQQWIDPTENGVLYQSDWRGPRRLHGIFTTGVDWESRREEPFRSRGWRARAVYDYRGRIRVRLAEGARDHLLQLTAPVGTFARRVSTDGDEERSPHSSTTAFYRTVARLAVAVAHGGPVLLVTSTRPSARRMAQAIAELLPPERAARPVAQFARLRLGASHPLVPVLERGVAYHHAALPVDILDAIEEGVRSEEITFIASTTTLTEGVNLPVRTVILAETRYEEQPVESLLRGARMLNAMGRAGRACRESEGWIFLAQNRRETPNDFDALQVGDDDLRVESRLASTEALEALALFEERIRTDEDAVFEEAAREIDDFVAFVWFVLAAEETAGREATEALVADALSATLGFTQLDQATCDGYVRLAGSIQRTYIGTDRAARRRWVRSGTSVRSARTLDGIVERVLLATQGRDDVGEPEVALAVLGESEALSSLLELPEAPGRWRFKTVETGPVQAVDVSPLDLLQDWISGMSVADLAQTHLEEVPAEDYRVEQMVDVLTQFFEHYLAWTVGAVVALVNERLGNEAGDIMLCPPLHLFIRYGVNTLHAVDLLVRGVRSREFATAVASRAIDAGADREAMRTWLGDMSIAEWRERFSPTPADILDLLEYTRARRGGLLRTVLEQGTAAVDVSVDTPSPETRATTIEEEPGDRPAAYSIRDADTGETLGRVPTRVHAEIDAVLRTGLPIASELRLETLTLRVLDE